jgi:hypothetical protein
VEKIILALSWLIAESIAIRIEDHCDGFLEIRARFVERGAA